MMQNRSVARMLNEENGVSSVTSNSLVRQASLGILDDVRKSPENALDIISNAVMDVYSQGMQDGVNRGRLEESRRTSKHSEEMLIQVVSQNAQMGATLHLARAELEELQSQVFEMNREIGVVTGHQDGYNREVYEIRQNHLGILQEIAERKGERYVVIQSLNQIQKRQGEMQTELGERKGESNVLLQSFNQIQQQQGEIQINHGALLERIRALEETTMVGQIMKVSLLIFKNCCRPVISSDFRWITVWLAFAMVSHKFAVSKGGLTKHSIGVPSRLAIPALVIALAMKVAELKKPNSVSLEKVRMVAQESFTWIAFAALAISTALYSVGRQKKILRSVS